MKKLFAILLASLMLLTFAACSGEDTSNSNDLDDYKIVDVVYTEWSKDGDTFYFDSLDTESVVITGFSSVNYVPHEVKIPAYFTFENKDAIKEEDKVKKFAVTGIADGAFANNSSISKITFAAKSEYANYDFDEVPYTIGDGAFRGCVSMTEVAIPEYVSALGEKAFYACDSLKTLQFADNCALTELAFSTFAECASLEEMTIPTSIKTIGEAAFVNCKALKKLVISEGVVSVGKQAFQGCEALETLELPVSLSDIGTYAFSGCSSLKDAKVPAWVVDSLEKTKLESIEIIAGTSLGNSAFKGCELLTTVIIPDSITEIGDSAFLGCKSLKEIALPEGITKIGLSVFKNCTSLEKVTISEHITSIGFAAFKGCVSLTEVKIPAAVASIDKQAFSSCRLLAKIEVAAENTAYQTIEGSLYTKDGTVLMQYAVGKTDETFVVPATVTTIDPCAFEGCAALTTLTVPATVTTIGNAAFNDCAKLANVTIPSWAIAGVPKAALQSVVINGGDAIAANAFANSPKLASVSIPASVTSIGKLAFAGCDALAEITVDAENAAYKAVDNVLYSKDGKTLIVYAPAKAETAFVVPAEVTAIEASAFANATKLADLTVPATVATIGNGAFNGCNALSIVNIPASVIPMISKTALTDVTINSGTEIAESAFAGCAKLASLVLADSITTIGANAFDGCALTALNIPVGVTSIGELAFHANPIETITVADENTAYKAENNALYTKDGTTLILYAAASQVYAFNIPDGVTAIAPSAFEGASNLVAIEVSESVAEIGENAFLGCDHLYAIINKSSLEMKVGSSDHGMIAANAIEVCTSIEDSVLVLDDKIFLYTIPAEEEGGEASVVILWAIDDPAEIDLSAAVVNYAIADGAFAGQTSLTTVKLSGKLTAIGENAFADCTALATIVFDGTKAEWEAIEKGDDWNLNMVSYTIDCTDEDIVVAPAVPAPEVTPAA